MGGCGSTEKINSLQVDYSHFEQQRCIGRGGFGKVHAVNKLSDPRKDEFFAIKTLEKDQIIKTNTYAEVNRELNLLKELNHQAICNGHYAFQDTRHLYLVMDLVTGGDMRVHINEKSKGRKKFSSNDVAYFISHLLVALEFCHNRNVLHRDIKPDNILICESGTLKLTDFGISHKLKSRESFCVMSSGTLEYMAPEILKKGHEHSWPSELYSVGVYMYELLLLSLPNELGNFSKLEDSAKAEKDPKMKAIKEFALKCLEPLLDDRFQTVKDAYANEMFEGADMKDWGKDSYPVKVSFKPDVSHTNVQDNAKQEDLMSAFGGEDDDDKPKIEEKFQTKFKSYGWNNMLKKESSLRSGRSSLIMGLKSIQNSGRISIGKAGNAAAKTAMKYSPETDNVKTDCPNQAPRSYREGRRNSDLGLAAA